jgi:N-methylhydantoinase A
VRLVGVDVGGTFSDLVLWDTEAGGSVKVAKVPTTPENPALGILIGLEALLGDSPGALSQIDLFAHGTTTATNALLEHKGAEVGLITTEGFRDIVHIGRHQRPQNYSIRQEIPWQDRPLVRRRNRMTVPERIVPPNGDVSTPLDEDRVREAVKKLEANGVESIAICFLFSYLNGDHERRVREIVEEMLPDIFVTTSVETVSQFREFERFTTTCANAFIGPKIESYVESLDQELTGRGLNTPVHLMRSNGGVATARAICESPVTTLLSGPAAGVIGGAWAGGCSDRHNVITLDVGGTSSDVGIVTDGRATEARARETWMAGYPLLVPIIDVHTIGAGGGSIAYRDQGGAVRVGPRSAGSQPGPACYARGGTEATVTDAHLTLGRLDPDHLLGGRVPLDAEAAEKVTSSFGDEVGLSTLEAADGILRVVNHNMGNAIRTKTVEKGIDPRQYSLVALGGAGPLHAVEVAALLDIGEVLIPPYPGITSAMGLLAADLKYDVASTTFLRAVPEDSEQLREVVDRLGAEARELLAADGLSGAGTTVLRRLECRYVGQGYELTVELPPDEGAFELDDVLSAFHQQHDSEYGFSFAGHPVEIVTARATGVGILPTIQAPELAEQSGEPEPVRERGVYFRAGDELQRYETPFYDRAKLGVGARIEGPCIVLQLDSTTVVPPEWAVEVDASANLRVFRAAGANGQPAAATASDQVQTR